MRAPAASAIAVACGTPMPSTPRLVHAWPGPTPTSTPTAPVRIEVQRGRVRRAASDDDRDLELANELLQVERFRRLRDVLGGDDRALDDQQVELAGKHVRCVLLDALGRERRARHHTGVLDLADTHADQLGLDGLRVDLLHAARRLLGGQLCDLLEERFGILVPGPQPFEVQAGEPTKMAHLDGGARRDDTVHSARDHGEVEVERIDLPGDVDVLGVARAAAGDDGDVVEPVGSAAGLADADLDFHPLPPGEGSRIPLRSGAAIHRHYEIVVFVRSARSRVRMRAVAPQTTSSPTSYRQTAYRPRSGSSQCSSRKTPSARSSETAASKT